MAQKSDTAGHYLKTSRCCLKCWLACWLKLVPQLLLTVVASKCYQALLQTTAEDGITSSPKLTAPAADGDFEMAAMLSTAPSPAFPWTSKPGKVSTSMSLAELSLADSCCWSAVDLDLLREVRAWTCSVSCWMVSRYCCTSLLSFCTHSTAYQMSV